MKKKLLLNFLLLSLLNASEVSIDELLEMDLSELQSLKITTATKSYKKLSLTPANVKVITAKEIKERGYLSLEEILKNLNGFDFRDIKGFNSYSFLRGIPNQNNLILILIDDVVINELNSGGFYGGLQYNLNNIKQIEVVYNPSSTLYGTNAISGIINIKTYSPKDNQNTLTATIGSENTKILNFKTSYTKDDFSYSLAGEFLDTDKIDLSGRDGDFNWGSNFKNFERDYSINAKFNYKEIDFGLLYQNKDSARATKTKAIDTARATTTNWNIEFFNLWLKNSHHFSNSLNLKSMAYYRNTTLNDSSLVDIFYPSDADLEGERVKWYRPAELLGIEEEIIYDVNDKLNLIAGFAFEREHLSNGFSKSSSSYYEIPSKPKEPKRLYEDLFSLYLQSSYKISENLELTLGARGDKSSAYDEVLTPKLSLVYNRDNFIAKLLYSEAFRAPKPWDYSDGIGNPSLEPEEMKAVELFLEYFIDKNFKIDFSIYHNELKNLFAKESLESDYRWINRGEATTKGIEASLNYTNNSFKYYINYTFTNSNDEDNLFLDEIAKHKASSGLTYYFTKEFIGSVGVNYFGKRKNPKVIPATNSNIINSATIFNANLNYFYKKFDFSLICKNLFDKSYYHTSNLAPERYLQNGRDLYLQVNYKF